MALRACIACILIKDRHVLAEQRKAAWTLYMESQGIRYASAIFSAEHHGSPPVRTLPLAETAPTFGRYTPRCLPYP